MSYHSQNVICHTLEEHALSKLTKKMSLIHREFKSKNINKLANKSLLSSIKQPIFKSDRPEQNVAAPSRFKEYLKFKRDQQRPIKKKMVHHVQLSSQGSNAFESCGSRCLSGLNFEG
jgi:hypothetical protein